MSGRINEQPTCTVGDLRRALRFYDDDAALIFGNGDDLTFYRVKNRGPTERPLVQIEFNEIYTVPPQVGQ